MPYQVRILPPVRRQVASWRLSDALLVDVYLRLQGDLAEFPARHLVRVDDPFDGLVFFFEQVDPENRLLLHQFFFQVAYTTDEQALLILRGAHRTTTGL